MGILKNFVAISCLGSLTTFAYNNGDFYKNNFKLNSSLETSINAIEDNNQYAPFGDPVKTARAYFWSNPVKSKITFINQSPAAYNVEMVSMSCRFFYQDIAGNGAGTSTSYFNGSIPTGKTTELSSDLAVCVKQVTCAITIKAPGEPPFTFDKPGVVDTQSCLTAMPIELVGI